MIVLLRANDIITDSRVLKYLNFFEKSKINYRIIGWNRDGNNNKKNNTYFFEKKAGYNLGKKAILNRFLWNLFLLKKLIKIRKQYKIIHACDFDTVLPALIMKIFFNKKVIFDIFDWFSDTIITNNFFIDRMINILEKKAVKMSDYVIICEEERKKQIKIVPKKLLILPNIPNFIDNRGNFSEENKKTDILKISYVGGLYEDRNIHILLEEVSKNSKLYLYIAGFGDVAIEGMCEEYSKKFSNIKFYGRVKYEEGINIMANSNIIYAMYCKTNRNHLYAAPNKYYESLMLGKPLITTVGTIVGEKVSKYNTGFVIGEKSEDTRKIFDEILNSNIHEKSENCLKIWEENYKNYMEVFFNTTYKEIILK